MTVTATVSRRSGAPSASATRLGTVEMVLASGMVYVLFSPFLGFRLHGLVGVWALFFGWAVVAGFRRSGAPFLAELTRRRPEALALGAWLSVVGVNAAAGRGYTGEQHFQIAVTVGLLFIVDTYYTSCGKRAVGLLRGVVFTALAIEIARSLPVLWNFPMLPRQIMLFGATSEAYAYAMSVSVGEYGFYTACSLLIPTLVARVLDKKGAERAIGIVQTCLVALAIVLATFAGAILLMILGFTGVILLSLRKGTVLRTLIVSLIAVVVATSVWMNVLFESDQAQYFVNKFQNQVIGIQDKGVVEGDRTLRVPLWLISIDTIYEHPVFGVGASTGRLNPNLYTLVGGHSSWLDTPAEYGLVGFAALAAYLYHAIRRAARTSTEMAGCGRAAASARRVMICLFLAGGVYNPVLFQLPMMVVFVMFAVGGVSAADSRRGVQQ